MRYAIVSDIHANFQAWNAVLIDIRSQNIDRILCLGDVIGYGPNPAETLRSVHANIHDFVLGNHDAAFCGKIDSEHFNANARLLLDWTRKRLNRQAVNFFSNLPLSLTGPGFRCTHGSFDDPARFDYVIEPADALACWQSVPEQLLFCGHTHVPCIFVVGDSGTAHRLAPQDFVLEPGKRFLVNCGSVGQSRDNDTRASYLVYDDARQSIIWRRIPFDLDAFKSALDDAGLSKSAARFLAQDPRRGRQPLRAMLGFNPPETAGNAVRDTLTVRDIQTWKHRAVAWRKRCAMLGGLTLAGILGTVSLYWQYGNPAQTLQGPPLIAVDAHPANDVINLIPPLQTVAGNAIPPGWHCRLGNRLRQSVNMTADTDGALVLRLQSETDRVPIVLSAAPVQVSAGERMQLRAMIRKTDDFAGSIAVVMGLEKDADHDYEIVPRLRVQEPTLRRSDGWFEAMRTFEIPAGGKRLYYRIDGAFHGSVEIKDLQLLRR